MPREAASKAIGYRLHVASRHLKAESLLPGRELVEKGLSDLAESVETMESLLVSIGSPRLRRLGFEVTTPFDDAEERLYLMLARDNPNGAHSRYNALIRRLVSFERAAESAS
jgi:hypothetical protein